MALKLTNIKLLLQELRNNDWYITSFEFTYNGHDYVVVFEDLREVDRGTKLYAVNLTFIDVADDDRVFSTYANSYNFSASEQEIRNYFGIEGVGYGNAVLYFYDALNTYIPIHFVEQNPAHHEYLVTTVENRLNNEGLCCYKARHNPHESGSDKGKRSAQNTAKTKLLRPALFERLGKGDPYVSFCYRQENPLSDTDIIRNFTGH